MLATVGTDPEVFVKDKMGIISAIGLIGGSKQEPKEVPFGALQEDNVLAEFNIDPANSSEEFTHNIEHVMNSLKLQLGTDKDIDIRSSYVFGEELKDCKEAMEFGCDPDYDAWTQQRNPTPNKTGLLRTAGGHVHIGYDQPDEYVSYMVARLCDYYLGFPSVVLDADKMRRTLYGQAGACRIKPYGVEYRSLSNFWLASKQLQEWVYNTSSTILDKLDHLEDLMYEVPEAEVKRVINTSDLAAARRYCDELSIIIPEV